MKKRSKTGSKSLHIYGGFLFCKKAGVQVEQCTEERRFENIENDVKEIKDQIKANTTDINQLKESSAETKIYVKQIFERIDDLKFLFKSGAEGSNKVWVGVVQELIKMVAIVAGIIAGMKLL